MKWSISQRKPIIVLLLFIVGCTATVPTVQVWQPWRRVLSAYGNIYLGSSFKTEVQGQTEPLLGSEELLMFEVNEILEHLLERRGFKIDRISYDYRILLIYRTERHDEHVSFSAIRSSSNVKTAFSTAPISGATYGLGVKIAQAIGLASLEAEYILEQTTKEIQKYTHIITLEISDRDENLIWKGEATWDSGDPNINLDLIPTLQLILSSLPSDPSYIPTVEEIKPTHTLNYYKLVCEDNWFSCPALPYRIAFKKPAYINKLPKEVKNPGAFQAYVDLIQTSEYALPVGDYRWENPTRLELWRKVILGNQYMLGSNREPVNILMELSGSSDGYYITKCWIASDDEFAHFQEEMSKWRKALEDYCDVFEH